MHVDYPWDLHEVSCSSRESDHAVLGCDFGIHASYNFGNIISME